MKVLLFLVRILITSQGVMTEAKRLTLFGST